MKLLQRIFRCWPVLVMALLCGVAQAHGVAESDKAFILQSSGVQFVAFLYLGAKHMITGYDHLLFLFGVIFFLYRVKDIGLYVTLFAVGHSVTLMLGVLMQWQINAFLIDAIIGFSVVYKALENMGAWQLWLRRQPDTRIAVLIFGLFHGLGLATKLQEFALKGDGLVINLIAFNIGVEVGQFLALCAILIAMAYWRRLPAFHGHAFATNTALMSSGFVLMGFQLFGYAYSF